MHCLPSELWGFLDVVGPRTLQGLPYPLRGWGSSPKDVFFEIFSSTCFPWNDKMPKNASLKQDKPSECTDKSKHSIEISEFSEIAAERKKKGRRIATAPMLSGLLPYSLMSIVFGSRATPAGCGRFLLWSLTTVMMTLLFSSL